MATRGERPYEVSALETFHRARAARRGTAVVGLLLALLGPAVVWLRVVRGVPLDLWAVPCGVAAIACVAAAVLARAGRTKRALALIVTGVVLVLAGDLIATATVS
ncbi:hypothetical protein [Streptomyces boluensis]|uniref:Uncharacterized protein n=1 Tax=Streptomyces boluensis TaxID=1775135 RepID=A0A964XLN4_9ACTN|nr:hypothetical protein [Streptomyces boluensis]NBE53515.1 hypothetical protein [Streptomyces boluensis]